MRPIRRHRFLTNLALVLLVLTLSEVSGFVGSLAARAGILIVILMGLQTLVFAEPQWRHDPAIPGRRQLVQRVRIAGLAITGLLALVSYIAQRIFVLGDWQLRPGALWLLLPICFSAWLDGRSSRPYRDEYWTLGAAVLPKARRLAPAARRNLGASAIKVFFYPLMFVYLETYLQSFDEYWRPQTLTAAGLYDSLAIYYALVDLVFGAAGYALTLRILHNRVRSINPYAAGWLVTLVCYSPFWAVAERILIFQWHVDWIGWLKDWPSLQACWLLTIAACFIVYAWSTVELGPKFSNLTYRGLTDTGPYRLMKHPAYISKVLSFWLITVPFVPFHGVWFAIQQCAVLTLSCAIYYFRARYEEKHLLQYAEYKAYASRPILRLALT